MPTLQGEPQVVSRAPSSEAKRHGVPAKVARWRACGRRRRNFFETTARRGRRRAREELGPRHPPDRANRCQRQPRSHCRGTRPHAGGRDVRLRVRVSRRIRGFWAVSDRRLRGPRPRYRGGGAKTDDAIPLDLHGDISRDSTCGCGRRQTILLPSSATRQRRCRASRSKLFAQAPPQQGQSFGDGASRPTPRRGRRAPSARATTLAAARRDSAGRAADGARAVRRQHPGGARDPREEPRRAQLEEWGGGLATCSNGRQQRRRRQRRRPRLGRAAPPRRRRRTPPPRSTRCTLRNWTPSRASELPRWSGLRRASRPTRSRRSRADARAARPAARRRRRAARARARALLDAPPPPRRPPRVTAEDSAAAPAICARRRRHAGTHHERSPPVEVEALERIGQVEGESRQIERKRERRRAADERRLGRRAGRRAAAAPPAGAAAAGGGVPAGARHERRAAARAGGLLPRRNATRWRAERRARARGWPGRRLPDPIARPRRLRNAERRSTAATTPASTPRGAGGLGPTPRSGARSKRDGAGEARVGRRRRRRRVLGLPR